jgi:hypothetical protein
VEETPVLNPWQAAYFRLELDSQKTIVDLNINYVKTSTDSKGCADAIMLLENGVVTEIGENLKFTVKFRYF